MSDDIVTRLRDKARSEAVADGFLQAVDRAGLLHLLIMNVHTEAADEIERLRKIVSMMVQDYTNEYGRSFKENMKMFEEEAIDYLPEIKPKDQRQW